jgi:hypothetical protein
MNAIYVYVCKNKTLLHTHTHPLSLSHTHTHTHKYIKDMAILKSKWNGSRASNGFEYDCNMKHYIYTDIYWVMFYMNKLYTYVKMYQT